MPRIQEFSSLIECVKKGVAEGLFGLADSREGDNYRGIKLESAVGVGADDIIVKSEVARNELEKLKPQTIGGPTAPPDSGGTGKTSGPAKGPTTSGETSSRPVRRFYASIELEPEKMGLEASNIANEVISLLKSKYHADVVVTLEISAYDKEGFEEHVQRAVRENCNTLKFRNAEFEE